MRIYRYILKKNRNTSNAMLHPLKPNNNMKTLILIDIQIGLTKKKTMYSKTENE